MYMLDERREHKGTTNLVNPQDFFWYPISKNWVLYRKLLYYIVTEVNARGRSRFIYPEWREN